MPLQADLSDQALIRDARRGDLSALETFFTRHHARIYAYLARWLGDDDAARDLVQETFLKVVRLPDAIPGYEQLFPWLIRVARNLAIDSNRRDRRLTQMDEEMRYEDPGVLPLERLTTLEREAQLSVVMAALAPIHREVLLLRAVEGFSHEEIGATVGCTAVAARARLHRATLALRTAWFDRYGESHDD